MSRLTVRTALAAFAAAALLVAAAAPADAARESGTAGAHAAAKGKGKGKDKVKAKRKGDRKAKRHSRSKVQPRGKGKAKGRNVAPGGRRKDADKVRNAVFEGFVSAVDPQAGTVEVEIDRGNRWARPFVGDVVRFELSGARLEIGEDVNGDGVTDLADVDGEQVLVQARIVPGSARQPIAADRLVLFGLEDEGGDPAEAELEDEFADEEAADAGDDDVVDDEDDSDVVLDEDDHDAALDEDAGDDELDV